MEEIIHSEIAILGGGPAGYVAAIRAAQLQANGVVLIEKGQVGGTCPLIVVVFPQKCSLSPRNDVKR